MLHEIVINSGMFCIILFFLHKYKIRVLFHCAQYIEYKYIYMLDFLNSCFSKQAVLHLCECEWFSSNSPFFTNLFSVYL